MLGSLGSRLIDSERVRSLPRVVLQRERETEREGKRQRESLLASERGKSSEREKKSHFTQERERDRDRYRNIQRERERHLAQVQLLQSKHIRLPPFKVHFSVILQSNLPPHQIGVRTSGSGLLWSVSPFSRTQSVNLRKVGKPD